MRKPAEKEAERREKPKTGKSPETDVKKVKRRRKWRKFVSLHFLDFKNVLQFLFLKSRFPKFEENISENSLC